MAFEELTGQERVGVINRNTNEKVDEHHVQPDELK